MTQNELKKIGQDILKEFSIKNVPIKYKNVDCGRSRANVYITIPKWSLKRGRAYSIYYIIHEVSHQIVYKIYKGEVKAHGIEFKDTETELLERYGLGIVYKKAYAKELYYLKTSKLAYKEADFERDN